MMRLHKMMRLQMIYVVILMIFGTIGSQSLFGKEIKASSLKIIEDEIDQLDVDALVVFDIDDTLIQSNDRILRCGEKYIDQILDSIDSGLILESLITLQHKISVIDDRIFILLEKLNQRKIKVMAVTAMLTGTFGIIPRLEDWRIGQLHSVGIDFGQPFPFIDHMRVQEYENQSYPPTYKGGILASCGVPKGKVLVAFLKQIGWKPSRVVFVDDKMENVHTVEIELEKENIPNICFHYTAAADHICELDIEIAQFQIYHLIEQFQWLSDQEASQMLRG